MTELFLYSLFKKLKESTEYQMDPYEPKLNQRKSGEIFLRASSHKNTKGPSDIISKIFFVLSSFLSFQLSFSAFRVLDIICFSNFANRK